MKRPSILFFAKNPHNVVVYERVIRRLLADSRVRFMVSSKNETYKPANALFEAFGIPAENRVHNRLAAWKKYDLYLSPDMYLLARRSKVKVHTFHGVSIKGHAFSEKAFAFDKLFLIGPYQRRRFAELGVLREDDPRHTEIGMPKLDAFFDGSLNRQKFLTDRHLDPSRPTILYAPTWRPEASLHSHGEELVRAMQCAPYNFMIKLHDLSLDPISNRVDWRAKLKELVAPNIAILDDLDATPALHAADVLISDASSVANEYALLDRPIVFIEVPALFKKYGDTIDLESWGQKSGSVARTVPDVMKAVEASLADPSLHAETRRRIAAEGFYNPGKATEAALREIYRAVELAAPGLESS